MARLASPSVTWRVRAIRLKHVVASTEIVSTNWTVGKLKSTIFNDFYEKYFKFFVFCFSILSENKQPVWCETIALFVRLDVSTQLGRRAHMLLSRWQDSQRKGRMLFGHHLQVSFIVFIINIPCFPQNTLFSSSFLIFFWVCALFSCFRKFKLLQKLDNLKFQTT